MKYNLVTAQEIRKKLKVYFQKDISLQAIHYMAKKLGYHMNYIGYKRGYDASIILALRTRGFRELMSYDAMLKAQKEKDNEVLPNLGDYYTYNGERDNIDYEWEKNESIVSRIVMEEINKFLDKELV